MIRVDVCYPAKENGRFDFDYYTQKHIPMTMDLLKDYGCVRSEVDKGMPGPGGASPLFVCVGYLYFEDLERMAKGLEAIGSKLAEDMPNYTDIEPQIQTSEIILPAS
ncbi:MAG: EthD family reductase [Spirochaetes bacterium]|nr:EthD family reductase [Spirochaetota bacterium]